MTALIGRRVDAVCLRHHLPERHGPDSSILLGCSYPNLDVFPTGVAMKPHQTSGKSSEAPRDQFRIPRQPRTPGTSITSKSTTSKRTVSPSGSTTGRPWKRSSFQSSRAQSTLTQFDFVTQTEHSDNGQFDYGHESAPRAESRNTNDTVHRDGESDDDTDYRPPLRPRTGSTRFEMNDDHPKRGRESAGGNRAAERGHRVRNSQTPKTGLVGRGKRKSAEKPPVKRDKTLTQMDFVRRYITIDDDDDNDVNMGYIQSNPKGGSVEDGQQVPRIEHKTTQHELPPSAKRNRRIFEAEVDLSTGEPMSGPGDSQSTNTGGVFQTDARADPPVTPQMPRKLEIPSSQSPESPGLAIITSSQFRSATRSPLKQKSSNFAPYPENTIKEESPGSQRIVEDSQDPGDTSLPKTPTHSSPRKLDSLKQHSSSSTENVDLYAPPTESASQIVPSKDTESRPERTQREKTVVYETDAETDHSGSEDDLNNNPTTPTRAREPQAEGPQPIQHSPTSSSDDSQEVPLPGVQSSADLDSGPPSEAPMSDASIFYQRMQPATQFPHEPIPTLNTQNLTELFPNDGSTQYPRPAVTHPSQKVTWPFLQSPTQSQEADQTEIVPESSPVREQENGIDGDEAVFQRPRAPDSVVQVESSQPVDRGYQGPGRIISRSQLLTSSVMESVPLPTFWMGSQDSVGEPYSLPDR